MMATIPAVPRFTDRGADGFRVRSLERCCLSTDASDDTAGG
jgi:hypothetical protein